MHFTTAKRDTTAKHDSHYRRNATFKTSAASEFPGCRRA